jgi:hypothetical protein
VDRGALLLQENEIYLILRVKYLIENRRLTAFDINPTVKTSLVRDAWAN